jgi:pimeloyl-ACP methyl ester carboxylesterase
VAVAGVVAAGAGTVAVLPAARAADAGPGTSRLTWGACPGGPVLDQARDPRQRCATMRVPVDYRVPKGRTIELTVSRIPATDPAARRGVLMVNGGGPSASLDVPSVMTQLLPAEVTRRYDLVSFDPRGIGYSTPISCGRDVQDLIRDQQYGVLSFPSGDGSIDVNVRYGREVAEQCATHAGALLPHLSTANIARDMDQIRRALGERQVSYFGVSWGTYLGPVYRALFPNRVDRMVLDSAVDPNARGYTDFRMFSIGMEDRWPDLAAAAVDSRDAVRFGDTPAKVRTTYLAVAAKLDRRPVTVPGTAAPLNGNLLRLHTFLMSYQDTALLPTPDNAVPPLMALWRAAANFADGTATAADAALVTTTANAWIEGAAGLPGIPADNLFSVGWAISCGDEAFPRDLGTYLRNTASDRAAYPLTAGGPANIHPCSFWKTRPVEPAVQIHDEGQRNVLILQNRRDPATPLAAARGMRRALGSRAVLVEVDAGGHGVILHPRRSACAIDPMTAYLTGGQLPQADIQCPQT